MEFRKEAVPGVESIGKSMVKDVLNTVKDRVQGAARGELPKETSRVGEKFSREDIEVPVTRCIQRLIGGKILY